MPPIPSTAAAATTRLSIQGPGLWQAEVGSPFAISATMMTNVETLLLEGQNNYYLQTADGVVASGKTLTVDFQAIGAGRVFNFDGSAETDGSFQFNAGASFTASDSIKGGAKKRLHRARRRLFEPALHHEHDAFERREHHGLRRPQLQPEALGRRGRGGRQELDRRCQSAAGRQQADLRRLVGDRRQLHDLYGAGDDNITGGGMADQINLKGASITVHAGGGDDAVLAGAFLTAADTIDGGAGTLDQLTLVGDYTGANALVLGAATITNVEYLTLGSGHSYDITTNDATVASGQSLLVNAIGLTAFDRADLRRLGRDRRPLPDRRRRRRRRHQGQRRRRRSRIQHGRQRQLHRRQRRRHHRDGRGAERRRRDRRRRRQRPADAQRRLFRREGAGLRRRHGHQHRDDLAHFRRPLRPDHRRRDGGRGPHAHRHGQRAGRRRQPDPRRLGRDQRRLRRHRRRGRRHRQARHGGDPVRQTPSTAARQRHARDRRHLRRVHKPHPLEPSSSPASRPCSSTARSIYSGWTSSATSPGVRR